MKKKISLVVLAMITLASSFLIYTSCKKNTVTEKNSIQPTQTNSTNKRVSGTETYFSKDPATNTIYKLSITKNNDNEISFHREVITESTVDNASYLFDDDVNYTTVDATTIEFNGQENINTFLIPFNPNQDPQNFISGGDKYKFVGTCSCELAITNPASCDAKVSKAPNGTITFFCTAKNCQSCKLHVKRVKIKDSAVTELSYSGGFIILTASTLSEY